MKILLPVDGSRCALNAVRMVAERLWPRAEGLELLMLHVHYRIPNRAAAAAGRELVDNFYRKGAEEALATARALLDRHGIPYKVKRVIGEPGEAIAQAAGSNDLVVIGSHGLGAAKGLLLGSVTQTVIAECETPLLVVREGHLSPPEGEVLVAVDGSAHTRRAVSFLLRNRQWLAPRGRITFMHVSPGVPRLPSSASNKALAAGRDAEFASATRDALRLADKAGVRYRTLRVSGDPGEKLANHARGNHSSLLVMGSHGRGGLTSLMLGSVAQKTIAGCSTPTLIVR
ncbi:MAG: universal stress protein [Betaproteobacteria bacterium]|jgi:nucleotide-binding universal stress UspA family protein